jgi:hypothetical protein
MDLWDDGRKKCPGLRREGTERPREWREIQLVVITSSQSVALATQVAKCGAFLARTKVPYRCLIRIDTVLLRTTKLVPFVDTVGNRKPNITDPYEAV